MCLKYNFNYSFLRKLFFLLIHFFFVYCTDNFSSKTCSSCQKLLMYYSRSKSFSAATNTGIVESLKFRYPLLQPNLTVSFRSFLSEHRSLVVKSGHDLRRFMGISGPLLVKLSRISSMEPLFTQQCLFVIYRVEVFLLPVAFKEDAIRQTHIRTVLGK